MSETPIKGYMCATDWHHELGHAHDGNKVYPSVKAIKRELTCTDECGIVQVEVRFIRTVKRGSM